MRSLTVGKKDGNFVAILTAPEGEKEFPLKAKHLEYAEIEALQVIDYDCDVINLMDVSRKNIILAENRLNEDEIHKNKKKSGDGNSECLL